MPVTDVVALAEAAVPRGNARRQGKAIRAKERHRNKTKWRNGTVLSDEQRGVRHVSRRALNEAVRSGTIERRSDWCRLVRDPVRTQRPWMEMVFARLGDAHPTLSGRLPKPPPVAVHQLKITLLDTEPPIWRRVQVRSDTTLAELHQMIQIVMGWEGYHLHSFGNMAWGDYCDADGVDETTPLGYIAPAAGGSFRLPLRLRRLLGP